MKLHRDALTTLCGETLAHRVWLNVLSIATVALSQTDETMRTAVPRSVLLGSAVLGLAASIAAPIEPSHAGLQLSESDEANRSQPTE